MADKREARAVLHLPRDLYEALGRVAALDGQIYHLLTMTLHRTTDLTYDEAVARVENDLRSRKEVRREVKEAFRQKLVASVSTAEAEERSKRFDSLIDAWAALCGRRDDVLHCNWSVGCSNGDLTATRKGELLLNPEGNPLGIADVVALADDMAHFFVQLDQATEPSVVLGPLAAKALIPRLYKPGTWQLHPEIDACSTAASTDALGAKHT